MRQRTSITLEPETLRAVDEMAGDRGSRSRVIEAAVLDFVARHRRATREAMDRKILDDNAKNFANMMAEVLADQIEIDDATG